MSRLSARWRRRAGRGGSLALVALSLPAGASAAARWSDAAVLTRCPRASAPRAAFPAADPQTASGPGAILWSGECPAGAGAGVGLAPIGAGDLAGSTRTLAAGPLAATTATGDGRIVIAAGLGSGPGGPAGVLEGRAGSSFGPPSGLRALTAPLAAATSYLGDIAVATVTAGARVQLRLQRHGSPGLSAPVTMSARPMPVSALAVGLDYRGDALVVWAQDGWIKRSVLRSSGHLETAERVAPSPAGPHLQALISDDDRGIVAWSADVSAHGETATRVYLDASRQGVHFGPPRLVERFRAPPGATVSDASPRLVRLASEGVMMAWTGMSAGHYAVKAASVSLGGPRPTTVVSDPSTDAVLADLATGPHDEALAVWTSGPRLATGSLDDRHQEIFAARGVAELTGVAAFSLPEPIAGPGPLAAPRAAIDPASDIALAAWETPGAGIAYAVRRTAGQRRGRPAAHVGTARPGGRIGAWGVVSLLAVASAAVVAGARRARRARPTLAVGPPAGEGWARGGGRPPGRRPGTKRGRAGMLGKQSRAADLPFLPRAAIQEGAGWPRGSRSLEGDVMAGMRRKVDVSRQEPRPAETPTERRTRQAEQLADQQAQLRREAEERREVKRLREQDEAGGAAPAA